MGKSFQQKNESGLEAQQSGLFVYAIIFVLKCFSDATDSWHCVAYVENVSAAKYCNFSKKLNISEQSVLIKNVSYVFKVWMFNFWKKK